MEIESLHFGSHFFSTIVDYSTTKLLPFFEPFLRMQHPTHYIDKLFYWLGFQIGKRPIIVIISCLIFTTILSSGMIKYEEANNVRSEYSPLNAPSQKEYAIAKSFLKQVNFNNLIIFLILFILHF